VLESIYWGCMSVLKRSYTVRGREVARVCECTCVEERGYMWVWESRCTLM